MLGRGKTGSKCSATWLALLGLAGVACSGEAPQSSGVQAPRGAAPSARAKLTQPESADGEPAKVELLAPAANPAPYGRVYSVRYISWVWIPRDVEKPRGKWVKLGFIRTGYGVPLREAELAPPRDQCRQGYYAIEPRGYVCADGTTTQDPEHPVVQAMQEAGADLIEQDPEAVFPYHYAFSIGAPMYERLPTDEQHRLVMMRFRERHQDPNATDIEYAAEINGFKSVDEFIAAHAGSPWFVSMVGFVAGLPFLYQMVERQRQIEVPKYLRPRTDTPKLTVGYGGCFSCIYSVRGAGGYQMFGITPMPIYDPEQKVSYLTDEMCFFKPGDIVKWKPITRDDYDAALEEVALNRFEPVVRECRFSLSDFNKDIDGTNAKLMEVLHGR